MIVIKNLRMAARLVAILALTGVLLAGNAFAQSATNGKTPVNAKMAARRAAIRRFLITIIVHNPHLRHPPTYAARHNPDTNPVALGVSQQRRNRT